VRLFVLCVADVLRLGARALRACFVDDASSFIDPEDELARAEAFDFFSAFVLPSAARVPRAFACFALGAGASSASVLSGSEGSEASPSSMTVAGAAVGSKACGTAVEGVANGEGAAGACKTVGST